MLESYPMYWDKRAALEFGISSSEGKAIEAGLEQYFHRYMTNVVIDFRYNDWYEQQQSYIQGTMWEETTMNMLVRVECIDLKKEPKCCLGRIIYLYETWIVFCGLPVTLVIFTILMMLYLTNVVRIRNFILIS